MRKKLSEVDLELLAMVQENYFALLNHPLDSWRVHNQRALVNALNMVCYVTGESAQEAQDRCELYHS